MYKLPVFLLIIVLSVSKTYGQSFIEEISKRAIPLDTNFLISQQYNPPLAAALLKQFNSYSALGLGEATHGTHEFFIAKANLIQQLIKLGHYDRIGIEAPYAEVEELNQFLLANKGDLTQLLKSLRQYTYETTEFADLIYSLQRYNKNAKVKVLFYGFDFQSPFKALANFRLALRGNPQTTLTIDSLEAAFYKRSNELYNHQLDPTVYAELLQWSNLLYAYLDTVNSVEIQQNLKNYQQFLDLNNPRLTNTGVERISEIRDSMMADHIHDEINSGHAMLVWAHNGHIQRANNAFSKSMGQYLQEKLRGSYGSVGMTTYQGFYTAYNNQFNGVSDKNPLAIPLGNHIEYYLQQLKFPHYLFQTNALVVPALINKHRFIIYSATENQYQAGNMIDVFDFILFITKTTGSSNFYIQKE